MKLLFASVRASEANKKRPRYNPPLLGLGERERKWQGSRKWKPNSLFRFIRFQPPPDRDVSPSPPFLHPSLLRWRVGKREKGPHYRFFEYLLPSSSSSLPPTSFPMIYLSFSPLFQTLRQVGGRENLEGTMMCPQFARVEKTLLWA